MFDLVNISHFLEPCFLVYRNFAISYINSSYKWYRNKIINICTTREENKFTGDGQSNLPEYSTKYVTYSLMRTDLNKIVNFFWCPR